MTMLIHINRERFQSILAQSYSLHVPLPNDPHIKTGNSGDDEANYHLLDGELGRCSICGVDEVSIVVNTPVELEIHKMEQRMMEDDH